MQRGGVEMQKEIAKADVREGRDEQEEAKETEPNVGRRISGKEVVGG